MESNNIEEKNLENNIDGCRNLYILCSDLGMVSYEKKEYKKALNHFKEALEHYDLLYDNISKNPETPNDLLESLQQQVADVKSKIIGISSKLGDEEFKKKRLEEALNYYKNLLPYVFNNLALYFRIGYCLKELGAYTAAVRFLEKVAKLEPENTEHLRVIGDIYNYNLGNSEKAIEYYTQYVEHTPANKLFHIIYNILGHLYENVDKYGTSDIQIEYFEKAVELAPDFQSALRNLAIVYPRVGRDADAIECYHKIFKLGATMDDYFDYAALQIKQENFEEGWKYYEYRFSKENGATPYPKMKQPKWKGQAIPDKTLLVQSEQGFGDSIQFFRYLPQLKSLAKKVIFRVQNSLVDLLQSNTDFIQVVGNAKKPEELNFDYHVPLMSLMHLLDARVENIPYPEGYIKANPELVEKFRKQFFDNDCLKIGITWHGSAVGNERRNIPLSAYYPLTQLKNVKVYSFQKDKGTEQIFNLPKDVEIIDLGKEFQDFSDTAAAMANLDLFITSDNAVFNLAGAMGKETFVLLSADAEWRWFFCDKTMPWYDSVRIFKKKLEKDSWDLIMTDVVKTVAEKAKK